jgi:hypothetical protein
MNHPSSNSSRLQFFRNAATVFSHPNTSYETDGAPQSGTAAAPLYSFMPAKPGVGATKRALRTAPTQSTDAAHRGFLLEVDLEAGVVGFQLKLESSYSVIDAFDALINSMKIFRSSSSAGFPSRLCGKVKQCI